MLFSSPCIEGREVFSEASAGVCMGLVLSLVNVKLSGADAVHRAEGKMCVCVIVSIRQLDVVLDPGTCTSSLSGTGRAALRPPRWWPHREDQKIVVDDERSTAVRPFSSSCEVDEQR
jgi:hypothetical protein